MPYVDLYSVDDYAALWYTTNTPYRNVGCFDPEKPTIMILHPMFLCSRWLDHQFGDSRLDSGYNIIAFDMRTAGNSVCRPSGKHDSWVDAADLAFAARALHLPPVHILALESISVLSAMRFAVLFPEMCLSLTLSNIPSPVEEKWLTTAFDELLQSWCCASDLESFEHVAMEATRFVVGPSCDPDLQDELISYWETEMPPTKSQRLVEQLNVLLHRAPLKPSVLARINQPVLILHAERNETCLRKYADRLAEQLVNAQGGAIVYTVRGASGCLSIVPGHASIANQAFVKFLARLPRARSELTSPEIPLLQRMQQALNTLSEIMGDESIAQRDPLSSLSFSCLPEEIVKNQAEALAHYGESQRTAFTPLGPDRRPIRKYSERKSDHWFHSEQNGLSYAGASLLSNSRQKKEHEPGPHECHLPLPSSESVSPHVSSSQSYMKNNKPLPVKLGPENRVRRTNVISPGSTTTLDKIASMHSPMARVVGSPPIIALQKLL